MCDVSYICCDYMSSYHLEYVIVYFFFFFKQKTAYEMSISDWSSDVCSSDLITHPHVQHQRAKDVAVVIDQPLAVAQQMPLALETRVESLHHFRHTGGNPGVVDLEVGGVHAKPLQAAAHRFVTADEQIGRAHV